MCLQPKQHRSEILEFRPKLEVIPFKFLSKMVTFSVTPSGKREPEGGDMGLWTRRKQHTRGWGGGTAPQGGPERQLSRGQGPAAAAATKSQAQAAWVSPPPPQQEQKQTLLEENKPQHRGSWAKRAVVRRAGTAAVQRQQQCARRQPSKRGQGRGGGQGKSLASLQRQGTKVGGNRAPVQGLSFTYLFAIC